MVFREMIMSGPENEKWLDDALSETIGSKETRANFEQWKLQHPEAVNMLTSQAGREDSVRPRTQKTRIRIMRSPITKLAAAAAIIVAVFTVMSQFDKSSVVWAEVARKVENCRGFICEVRETMMMTVAGRQVQIQTRAEMYGSSEHGIRQDRYQDDQLSVTVYMTLADNRMVSLLHQMKKYGSEPLEEGFAEEFAQISPQKAVADLLSKDHKKLGRRIIDGRQAEGVEVSHKGVTTRVWVAVDTKWPILYEVQKAGQDKPHLVMDKFQWDVELATEVFEPRIPDDYTLLER